MIYAIEETLVNLFCQGPANKRFTLYKPKVFVTTIRHHCCSTKIVRDNISRNEHDYILINFTKTGDELDLVNNS